MFKIGDSGLSTMGIPAIIAPVAIMGSASRATIANGDVLFLAI